MTEIVQKIYTCCIRNQIFLGMKILSITLSIIFMMAIKESQSDQAINSNQQGIVAVVNTDIISKFDFIDRIRLVIFTSRLPNNQQTIKRISPQILRGLINEKLKIQKTNKLGIKTGRAGGSFLRGRSQTFSVSTCPSQVKPTIPEKPPFLLFVPI